ncbi:PilN domain-containing protein [Xanthomonas arboricola pv. juglandis]|uniref:PilN domain-containing protein n=1 Tax=Xanthomonas arboricola TaxID=56448 RepID=UPI00063E74BB|nr:PilN domain-containing protein [Xanthomonas arboricola]MDN0219160.1 PilN domain-containing protein [Xanthomonas arboricola pv. juglandis]MDN0223542.1 PilN domain-containing protein [Xanthomonas arboricola pv. juglandis]MDN0227996.1 PilN domain-containing protein [Xanthomonas arboricola pv. juglandis]MDN0232125.1 PilN domain-containing protein [Xanthomonas arboricola pv. juglandis]MDN0236687.1 PilN domain-containing protein [Xanthomonas arboricola pv. juglandis]
MARINLLPWRAERRKAREREFYSMLGFAALAGVLLSGLIWFYYDAQISGQTERNAFLTAEIDKVKAQNEEIKELDKKKDRLLARKKVIEELQANRSQMVHLFDSLVRTIPDGVALTNIKQDGDTLTLEGRSQSNARVSAYMRNLEGSGWMTNPDLSIIEAKSQDKAGQPAGSSMDTKTLPYVFTLKVKLANPNEADKNGTAPVDAQAPAAAPAGTAPAGTPAATPAAPAPATPPAAAPVQPAPASANRPQEGAAS